MRKQQNHKDRVLYQVRIYGDPVLRKRAQPIDHIDGSLCQLAEDMFKTMYEAQGVGLAAPQIGLSIALAVIDPRPLEENTKPLVVINPKIVDQQGECSLEEGCLSIPEIRVDVVRPEFLVVEGLTLEGTPIRIETGGIVARILQHEIDHLNGTLFIDRLGMVQRQMIESQLQDIGDTRKREG